MWLVDEGLGDEGWVFQCQHRPGHLPGDHSSVTLDVSPPTQPCWGSGRWSLPLYYLSMPEYLAEAKRAVAEVVEQGPAGRSAAATWEAVKGAVMDHGREFGWRLAARRRLERRELERKARWAEGLRVAQPHDLQAAQRAQQAVRQLQQYDEERGDSQSRSLGALWAAYGEQGTQWFHRLGKQPPDRFPILQVRDPDGGESVSLCTPDGAARAGSILADYFDGVLRRR